jgi:hypothetical protein
VTYKSIFVSLMLSIASTVNLSAQVLEPPTVNATPNPALQKDVDDSQAASIAWLKLVDQGNYGGSWDTATKFIQLTFTKDQWIELLNILRKPLGTVTDRTMEDMRLAVDPPNVPGGKYIIIVYNTKFSGGNSAKELLTFQEYQGHWKLYTYNIAGNKQ